ncbi:MAG: hypothetical protein ACLTTO_08195 [Lachnospiraceae bacterium]
MKNKRDGQMMVPQRNDGRRNPCVTAGKCRIFLVASRFHAMIGALQRRVRGASGGMEPAKCQEVLSFFELGRYAIDFPI